MGKTVKLIKNYQYDVYITPLARKKMEIYCDLCDKEVGWMGFVEKSEQEHIFLISDFVLLRQEVHAATTEIDPKALLELWDGLDENKQGKMKIWGHSHVNMSPTPSGQDDDQMKYFEEGNDWFIRLITNKKGDMNITIYDYKNGIEIHTDELYTYDEEVSALRKQIQEEIKDKVKEKTYSTSSSSIAKSYLSSSKKESSKPVLSSESGLKIKYYNRLIDALNDEDYYF